MSTKDDKTEDGLERPLSETIELTVTSGIGPKDQWEAPSFVSEIPAASTENLPASVGGPPIALGEALQLVRFSKRDQTLMITGFTPHGRRLTFEQRDDRDGWYVVAAGRRRRPTERELGLVVASITQEMEAALIPDGQNEVRSAYRLAASSDLPGMPVRGLQAYRDLLLDEAEAYINDQVERLAVIAVEYQAFKRFAIRHGHRIGAAFVRALGERLSECYSQENELHLFHKAGKAFRIVCLNRTVAQIRNLMERLTCEESKAWIIKRVWGAAPRTHIDELNLYIGIAFARASERAHATSETLAQRLNDNAYHAAKLGQLKGHNSIQAAKTDYRTTIEQWGRPSKDDLEQLCAQMEDGPAMVMAEMSDYLHELVPADLEGMAVEGNVHALVHKAIARDGFWQGTIAMRIAARTLIDRFLAGVPAPEGQNDHVGGFALGDEFYGVALERDRLYFAWGDLNSAGATRLRAGLAGIQHAVGWRREDGGGIAGQFLAALQPGDAPLPQRVTQQAQRSFDEVFSDPQMRVRDAVSISDFLWTPNDEPAQNNDVVEGAQLTLLLPEERHELEVLERKSSFIARLKISGKERVAALSDSPSGLQVKLRIRDAVVSVALCVLEIRRQELLDMLAIVREDNHLAEDHQLDVLGFLRHIADILLMEQVKAPAKIRMALGSAYRAADFVKVYSLEDVREHHPGLFYEAVHHNLLVPHGHSLDLQLSQIIESTMLAQTRPDSRT